MLLPFVYYVLFCYYPMYGVTLAFKQYKPKLGIIGSPWASNNGMKYVLQVVRDPYFWTVFREPDHHVPGADHSRPHAQ